MRKLLELVGDPGTLYAADGETLARLGLPKAACETLLDKDPARVEATLEACERLEIRVLTLASEDYPAPMRLTPDAPAVLYCRGRLPVSGKQPWIGLVGSRQADARGLELAACVTVIGSEGQGVCEAFLSAAAREAVIPMSPRCESLNAAVAATVILWELRRGRK